MSGGETIPPDSMQVEFLSDSSIITAPAVKPGDLEGLLDSRAKIPTRNVKHDNEIEIFIYTKKKDFGNCIIVFVTQKLNKRKDNENIVCLRDIRATYASM